MRLSQALAKLIQLEKQWTEKRTGGASRISFNMVYGVPGKIESYFAPETHWHVCDLRGKTTNNTEAR
jgi:hypothetical protein